ncbi:MAG TPA: SDR family oxidoreductase [Armatimonadota bacterium]|jgi:3-oxoacyl-[acyl-carrier protein] reductase
MYDDSDDRVAIVTGAGRGIGRATALALSKAGFTVVAMARTDTDLVTLCDEALDGTVVMHVGSVTHDRDVHMAFKTASVLGDLSVVVNAAGSAWFGPTTDCGLDDWRSVVQTNLTGTFFCCREALRTMGDTGHIINIASVAGHQGLPNSAAYCASKWGVVGLTKSLAAEVRASGRHGIHFTLLSPGSTDTPLWDALDDSPDTADMLQPDDVANAILSIVTQPPNISVDEMMLMPAKGILPFKR